MHFFSIYNFALFVPLGENPLTEVEQSPKENYFNPSPSGIKKGKLEP